MSEQRTAAQHNDPREACRRILWDLARSFEANTPCRCADVEGWITATGHKHECPVNQAVRLDLAKAGIV